MVSLRNIILGKYKFWKVGVQRRNKNNERIFTMGYFKGNEKIRYRPVKVRQFNKLIRIKNAKLKLKKGNIKGAETLVFEDEPLTNKEVDQLKAILDMDPRKKVFMYTLVNGDTMFTTITAKFWPQIKKILTSKFVVGAGGGGGDFTGSDVLDHVVAIGIKSIEIQFLDALEGDKLFVNKGGKFFPFLNKSNIDLTRYQIISSKDNKDILKTHCLINVLQQYNIEINKLNEIKLAFECGVHFPKTYLKQVSEIINKKIVLYTFHEKENKIKKESYGVFKDIIEICLYQNHYFIYESTKYNVFSIKNYEKLKDYENFGDIFRLDRNKPRRNNKKKKCNSFQLVKMLMDNNQFESNSHVLNTLDEYTTRKDKSVIPPLTNIDNEQKLFKYEPKENKDKNIFFADCESLVNRGNHRGFMAGICKIDSNEPFITMKNQYADSWIKKSLNHAVTHSDHNDIIIYFHNLKYDYNLLKKHCHIVDTTEKDGQIYHIKIIHNGRIISLMDSYKLLPIALSKFQKTLDLPKNLCKKEGVGYTYYTDENLKNTKVKISEYEKHVNKKQRLNFRANVFTKNEKGEYIFNYDKKTQTFDPIAYYKYYLKYDVLVLKEGLIKYHKKVSELTENKIDLFNFLTVSSLTMEYMMSTTCFDGLYMTKSNLREYLARAVYGGRVGVNKKYQKKLIKQKIADYDACSLYPSAIYRLCNETGFSKGKAKRIIKKTKSFLDSCHYYVVTVRITKINKKQQIPFICHKYNNKSNYINELPEGKPFTVVIDKETLEDYIKFHKIEYEIIDGVYYNEGGNKQFGKTIKKLYDRRLIEKKAGNESMQQIIKLMLNSSYGKTIIKKSDSRIVIKSNKEKNQYIINNYNQIKEMKKINDKQLQIKLFKYDNSYNLSHVGCRILSMSKRIMNEVMALANDNGIIIYYQDTDSMHMNLSDVEKLEKLYGEEYKNKILNGKYMEQFHTDFKMKGAAKGAEIYSIMSVFLGKKCYIDRLESVNKKGEVINSYHIRMKGITEAALDFSIYKGEISDQYEDYENLNFFNNHMELFEHLSSGKSQDFILNPPEMDKVLFGYNNTGVYTKSLFSRTLQF